MGFQLKVEGNYPVNLGIRDLSDVKFHNEIPQDSNARATDNGVSIEIKGKLNFDAARANDPTLNLAKWSLVPSGKNAYQNVEVQVIYNGQVLRKAVLEKAFVMAYSETVGDDDGVGQFYLYVKQKKDEPSGATFTGGFPVE